MEYSKRIYFKGVDQPIDVTYEFDQISGAIEPLFISVDGDAEEALFEVAYDRIKAGLIAALLSEMQGIFKGVLIP